MQALSGEGSGTHGAMSLPVQNGSAPKAMYLCLCTITAAAYDVLLLQILGARAATTFRTGNAPLLHVNCTNKDR